MNNDRDKVASYIADKGLEGSGPMSVVSKFLPPPFRIALYALFSIVGLAGVVIAATQGNAGDIGINAIGLVLTATLAFFDLRNKDDQVGAARAAMDNENLAKDMYADKENSAMIEAPPAPLIDDSLSNGGGRIQTAADLFGSQDE